MTPKVRVAIVGLGSMGRNHLRVLLAMPEIEIVALCDSEAERLPSGPWKKLSDYRNVALEHPDYCVIASPTPTHSEMALHLIGQGLSLLVEKPLASSADEARAILKKSQSGTGKVAVGMIERFNQTVIEAKRLLQSKEFGKLLKVSTRRIGPPPGRDMGVGVLLDLGIHDLDLMQWITGEKLITTQSDFITGVVSPYDDLALVSGRLPSGALWHSEVSWLSPTKKRGLDFLFVSGAVSLDLLTGEVVIIRQSGEEHHWDVIRELRGSISSTSTVYGIKTLEPLLSMHETLVAAISSGDWSALPRLEDSLEVLDLIETLYSG
jgi:UDP-N-acetylglucosamine 3-dehydrogenase